MTVVIHNHSLESSAEQLPPFLFVRSIEALSIDAVEVPHAGGDVAVRGMGAQTGRQRGQQRGPAKGSSLLLTFVEFNLNFGHLSFQLPTC